MSDSLRPHGLYSLWNSSGQNTGVGIFPFSRGSSQPRVELRSPTLQVGSLPAEPQGKPKDTGVGILSLLQGLFPTQESELGSPALQDDSLPTELSGNPDKQYKTLIFKTSKRKAGTVLFKPLVLVPEGAEIRDEGEIPYTLWYSLAFYSDYMIVL